MNRNVESHFAQVPSTSIKRSIFDRSFNHKTSFNVGELIPFYLEEVLPGDSFKVTTSKVVRLQTMLTPIMDNMYLDTYFFFIPMRLCWTHTKEFFGENTSSAWVPSVTYTVPKISAPGGGFAVGTIADYMGIPTGISFSATDPQAPIATPFRAYALLCDSHFRDQNLSAPLNIPLGDANQIGTNGSNYINDVANGGKPFLVAKYHDYFTSCLPSPQKSANPVSLSIGTEAMVTTRLTDWPVASLTHDSFGNAHPLNWIRNDDVYPSSNGALGYKSTSGATAGTGSATPGSYTFSPANLVADLSAASAVTVNQLRLAFQLQRYYEAMARGGSRYSEICRQFFHTTNPDSRVQRPEYLGGNRVPLNISEVTNTAQTTSDFLGDLGAKSVTSDIHSDFEKSFTEHGYIIGVMCVRYDHSYPQGLARMWKRSKVTDYYWPTFASLGEQPVYTDEICATATNIATADVFGYQEAYAEYRYPASGNRVSGEMRPGIANTLASWHLSDYYTTAPTLSDAWIREDKTIVDRVLAVGSSVSNQVFCDIYCKNIATRPMPMYSVPGLIDHH